MDMTDPIESNAYAISYRLLGSRPAALAAAQIAAEKVRRRFDEEGGLDVSTVDAQHWLPMLIDYTVERSVDPDVYGDPGERVVDHAGLRSALRRRLVRASRMDRVVGSLVHLAGYSIADVASMLDMEETRVRVAARVIAPPPGVDYRDLGDPRFVGPGTELSRARSRRPSRSTIIITMILAVVVTIAVRCQGPRPTLVDEGAAPHASSIAHVIN